MTLVMSYKVHKRSGAMSKMTLANYLYIVLWYKPKNWDQKMQFCFPEGVTKSCFMVVNTVHTHHTHTHAHTKMIILQYRTKMNRKIKSMLHSTQH